jgi:hypothetical protein
MQMSANLNAELKVPDLWYDFYARFLPGALFVAIIYVLWPGRLTTPSGGEVAVLALASLIAGLVAQPVSSEITGEIHRRIALRVVHDEDYIDKQKPLDPRRILGKMHAETTFFIQCAVLGFVLLLLQLFVTLESNWRTILCNLIAVVVFLVLGGDMSWRRVRRAQRLERVGRLESSAPSNRGQQGVGD